MRRRLNVKNSNAGYLPYAGMLLNLTDAEESSLEVYCERVKELIEKLDGRAKRIWTGHNTFSHDTGMYFEKMLTAMENALRNGEPTIVPCHRPSPVNAMVAEGDYKTDFCSISIVPRYLTREDAIKHRAVRSVTWK